MDLKARHDIAGDGGRQGHRAPRQEGAILREIAQIGGDGCCANGDLSIGKMIARCDEEGRQ